MLQGSRHTLPGNNKSRTMNKDRTIESMMADSKIRLFTIHFSRKSAGRFFEMLRDMNNNQVVDVRLNNVSQLAGFTKRNDLTSFNDANLALQANRQWKEGHHCSKA